MYSIWRRPPHLMVSEPGSFAEYTIRVRKPQILADIVSDNAYPAAVNRALSSFGDEIAGGHVHPLTEDTADRDIWQSAWEPFEGASWFDLPWYFAETFFYRRVLEIVQYFQPGRWHHMDPFAARKGHALAEGLRTLGPLCDAMPDDAHVANRFARWIYQSVWGNRADLSNIAVNVSAATSLHDGSDLLLIDHASQVWSHLVLGEATRVDLVADNAGLELLVDLAFTAFLIDETPVEQVHIHLKPQPFFVSDAMPADCETAIDALCATATPPLDALGDRLLSQRGNGQLILDTDPFWATSLFFSQFPERLRNGLGSSDLLILKGDVNYRRLLEDRHWPATTRLEEITLFMPAPFVTLRTLKGELIVGLPSDLAGRLDREDPRWLINGQRGLIHFVPR